jgi:hypothetical protein
MTCPTCHGTRKYWNALLGEDRPCVDCDDDVFFHSSPKPDACDHDFKGWVDLRDEEGRVCGGTTVCTKCGMDAMSYSLRVGA